MAQHTEHPEGSSPVAKTIEQRIAARLREVQEIVPFAPEEIVLNDADATALSAVRGSVPETFDHPVTHQPVRVRTGVVSIIRYKSGSFTF